MRLLVLVFAFIIGIFSFAQKNPTIKELEEQRKKALREITNTNNLLKKTAESTANLADRIQLISNQIFSRQKVLNLLEQEIRGIETEQKHIEGEIVVLESELKSKHKNYAKAVDGMLNNRQSENQMLFILSGKSLTESYRRLRYLKNYSEWRKQQAEEIIVQSEKLKERQVALAKAKIEKTTLIRLRTSEQENLKKEEDSYQEEIGKAQKKQKDLEKLLAQKKKQADDLNNRIAKLIAEEVARQEKEEKRKAAERTKSNRTPSTTSPGSVKPESSRPVRDASENVVLSNNFAANKGRLPYPISGNHTIVTRFGVQSFHGGKVSISSGGIDIRSQAGSEAKSVFDGEVSYVAAIPGYNTCIIVRHGNYYTFYGNIQSIAVKQGDKVKTGQSLGSVYTDSDTGLSQLHFQLWRGTNKLNPEPWLR